VKPVLALHLQALGSLVVLEIYCINSKKGPEEFPNERNNIYLKLMHRI
jgi:hypothetical protein